MNWSRLTLTLLLLAWFSAEAQPGLLPGTGALTNTGDLSAQMVAGIDRFLMRQLQAAIPARSNFWKRDLSSAAAYARSVQTNRNRFRSIVGAIDDRSTVKELELVGSTALPALRLETDLFTVTAVRWPVQKGVFGEGLWLKPKSAPRAWVVAVPDADQTPELISGLAPGLPPERQWARQLAEAGCAVLVPALVDRQDTGSGNPLAGRFTNQPHREWIYRQAYELGRHIIGYECLKISAALDFLAPEAAAASSAARLGVAGYGEGGLIALYAAALDERAAATLVSGYFDSRQQLWSEPIYRNVFGLLREFGDAEIASLVLPRPLILEYSEAPPVNGPPAPRAGRSGAAPGSLKTPDSNRVEAELLRVRSFFKGSRRGEFDKVELITGVEGSTTGPCSDRALVAFLNALGVRLDELPSPAPLPEPLPAQPDPASRQERQVRQLETHTQDLLRKSESDRREFFWNKMPRGSTQEWAAAATVFRNVLADEVLGSFGKPSLPPNPRSRPLPDNPAWTGYEIVLDVYPEVFAWGWLLLPKNLQPGERRPTVVCQHGLEGLPGDVVNEDPNSEAFRFYKGFASRLAGEGFIVFAPHNPYRGGDAFRVLQRKANPLGRSLFSLIVAQHDRILDFLTGLPFVDPNRVGFYGLSYGGKTAMRVPAVLDRYALSICSADFNEWIYKNASVEFPGSYLYTGEYEMPEWNLGRTFNYAEMAALIAPRPFMVERGHQDGVGRDEWVAYEFAKVRRLYNELNLPRRTEIEFFNGPHTIHGVGTFDFLREHLAWPRQ